MDKNFSSLFGNEATKKRLTKAIKNSTLPHAFLISGARGSGKKTLARELAMALNCKNSGASVPCHACNTCRRIADGNFTDIYTLKRDGSKATIGVTEVRDFKSSVMLSPVESDSKVYIIDEAERLTVQAQNALLTFLEEPPRNTYILLLAESSDTILTTIKSRTQSIQMSRFEFSEMSEYVERLSEKARNLKSGDREAFESIIMSSDGVIGKALSIIEDGFLGQTRDGVLLTEKIMECIAQNSSYFELYSAMCSLPSDRKRFIASLESLLLALRDLMLLKHDEKCRSVFYVNRETAVNLAKKISARKLMRVYEILALAIEDALGNVGTSSIITSLATKIKLL